MPGTGLGNSKTKRPAGRTVNKSGAPVVKNWHALVIALAILASGLACAGALIVSEPPYKLGPPVAQGVGVWVIENRTGKIRVCIIQVEGGRAVSRGCDSSKLFGNP